MDKATRNKVWPITTHKMDVETGTKVHTGHFRSEVNNSLKNSRHSRFELFFAFHYFRKNTVYINMYKFNNQLYHTVYNLCTDLANPAY